MRRRHGIFSHEAFKGLVRFGFGSVQDIEDALPFLTESLNQEVNESIKQLFDQEEIEGLSINPSCYC